MKRKKNGYKAFYFFKLGLFIAIIIGLLIVYFNISNWLRTGIKNALEKNFHSPAIVSKVVWTPFSISLSYLGVVNKDKPQYQFYVKNFKAKLSFNHIIRGSFTIDKIKMDIFIDKPISLNEYNKLNANWQLNKVKKSQITRKKRNNTFTIKQNQFETRLKTIFNEYIQINKQKLSKYTESIEQLKNNINLMKEDSLKIKEQVIKEESILKDLKNQLEKAYKKQDIQTIITLLDKINKVKKDIDTLNKEFNNIKNKYEITKQQMNFIKNSFIIYTTNLKNNYKKIILNELGFFSQKVPSLIGIFINRTFLKYVDTAYNYYKKFHKFQKRYIQQNKKEKKKKIKRKKGENFVFPLKEPNPKFWIKDGIFNLYVKNFVFNGRLKDIISNNNLIKNSSKVIFSDEKKDKKLKIVIDWNSNSLHGNIIAQKYPLKKLYTDLITINKAISDFAIDFSFSNTRSFELSAYLNDIQYDKISQMYQYVKDINNFHLNINGNNNRGKWNLKINSDLDKKIGLLINKELNKQKEKAIEFLDEKFQQWYKDNIPSYLSQMNEYSGSLENIYKILKNKDKLNKMQEELLKEGKDYLNELKKKQIENGLKKIFK